MPNNFREMTPNLSDIHVIGAGEPLLFLGAANSPYDYYYKLFRILSKKYTIYFLDYPGVGKGRNMSKNHSLNLYLDNIDYLLETKKINNFHLAGISFGGLLAIEYLHYRKPQGVKSLILLSPLVKLHTTSKIMIGVRTIINQFQNWLSGSAALTQNVFTYKQFYNLKGKWLHSNFVSKSRFHKSHISKTLPTLLIVGGKDRPINSNYTIKMFRKLPNIKIIYYKHGSHDAFAIPGEKILSILCQFTTAN